MAYCHHTHTCIASFPGFYRLHFILQAIKAWERDYTCTHTHTHTHTHTQDGPSLVKKVKGSFLFKITGSDGTVHTWLVDLKKGNGSIEKGSGNVQTSLGIN